MLEISIDLKMSENVCQQSKALHLADDIWLVPCQLDLSTRKFEPICEPPMPLQKPNFKADWSAGEEIYLSDLVKFKGSKKWTSIANAINSAFHNGKPLRTGKICREHYTNHLDPGINKAEWTPEEDSKLFEIHEKIGNKWSKISKYLLGRTENQVKNRFKCIAKKISKSIGNKNGPIIKVHYGGGINTGSGFDSGIVQENLEIEQFWGKSEFEAEMFEYLEYEPYFSFSL